MTSVCPDCSADLFEDETYECEECGHVTCDGCMRHDAWGPLCWECYPEYARDDLRERIYPNVQP